MRQKEVKERLSQEMRDLHDIQIEKHFFHYFSRDRDTYVGFPTSLIKSIDEDEITIHVNLKDGVLTLWKDVQHGHLSLFDREARNRRIKRQMKKEVKT